MVIERGSVWWFDFGDDGIGHVSAKRRPVVVIASDAFNQSRIGTVVVAALTSQMHAAAFPGNVVIPQGTAGLPVDSVVKVTEIMTVDRYLLVGRLGTLPAALMKQIDAGLRLSLGL